MDGSRNGVDLASENEVLRRDLADARAEISAANEVLATMGRSVSDLDRVLDTIVENARRLSRADSALVQLRSGDVFCLGRSSGFSDDFVEHVREHPIPLDRHSLTGRVAIGRRPAQIRDVLAEPGYAQQEAQRLGDYRTIMGTPMLLEGDVVGVLQVFAAFSIWNRQTFGQVFGIFAASVNAVILLFTVNAFPFAAFMLFIVDILVIYALVAYGGRERAA